MTTEVASLNARAQSIHRILSETAKTGSRVKFISTGGVLIDLHRFTAGVVRMGVKFKTALQVNDIEPLLRKYSPARITHKPEESLFEFEIPLGATTSRPEFAAKLETVREDILAQWITENCCNSRSKIFKSTSIEISPFCKFIVENKKLKVSVEFTTVLEINIAKTFIQSLISELQERLTAKRIRPGQESLGYTMCVMHPCLSMIESTGHNVTVCFDFQEVTDADIPEWVKFASAFDNLLNAQVLKARVKMNAGIIDACNVISQEQNYPFSVRAA